MNLPDPVDERAKRMARWRRVLDGVQDGSVYLMPEFERENHVVPSAVRPTADELCDSVRSRLVNALKAGIMPPAWAISMGG